MAIFFISLVPKKQVSNNSDYKISQFSFNVNQITKKSQNIDINTKNQYIII